ncbi:hypothetical protein B0H19DRAFT_1271542 [Mycena capillaripes]|nr:hypothetical protein B0H19DRAFT_1271542 [Mycena capillaripes]
MPSGVISIRSPFSQEFLRSSQRLSASEFDLATQFISIGQQCVSYVDSAIARANSGAELNGLKQQRKDILEQADDFGQTPWHLGHICQYWRDTVLATPGLWSDIVIIGAHRYPLGKLATLLARSSNSPLKVLLWSSPFESADPNTTEFLQILPTGLCSHQYGAVFPYSAICASTWPELTGTILDLWRDKPILLRRACIA